MFSDIAADAITAAQQLEKTIINYNPEKIEKLNKSMHEIEHAADQKKHEMMEHLISEFITPIEREDIATLSYMLDDVLDMIEGRRCSIANVQKCDLWRVSLQADRA